MNSHIFTIVALLLIAGVFASALVMLTRELNYVRLLADYLGYAEVEASPEDDSEAKPPPAGLVTEQIRNEVKGILTARDPSWATKQIRGWQMRVQRLESALAFWVDLLRQLGLLFTVLGLGLSLALEPGNVSDLLKPLGLAVWTTVAGLALSLVLTAQFGMRVAVWADTCEKNIEAWDSRRSRAADSASKTPREEA